MQEIILTANNKIEVLQKAIEVLQADGVVVYPTETSYGLGADFFSPTAVAKIYQIKQRDKNSPLPVLVPDLVYATSIVDFCPVARSLAAQYWPGPLTLVLPFKHHHWQTYFDRFLALRVSSYPLAQSLVTLLGCPLVSTSANLSRAETGYTPTVVWEQFKGARVQPDLFINVGDLPKRPVSTIIKCDHDKVELLRTGAIKIDLNLLK